MGETIYSLVYGVTCVCVWVLRTYIMSFVQRLNACAVLQIENRNVQNERAENEMNINDNFYVIYALV